MSEWIGVVKSCGEFDRNYSQYGTIEIRVENTMDEFRYYYSEVIGRNKPAVGDYVLCDIFFPRDGERKRFPKVTKVIRAEDARSNLYHKLFINYYQENAQLAEKIYEAFHFMDDLEMLHCLLENTRGYGYSKSRRAEQIWNESIQKYLEEHEKSEAAWQVLEEGEEKGILRIPREVLIENADYFLSHLEEHRTIWNRLIEVLVTADILERRPGLWEEIFRISMKYNLPKIFWSRNLRPWLEKEDLKGCYKRQEETLSDSMKKGIVDCLPENILEECPFFEPYATDNQKAYKLLSDNRKAIKKILKERGITCMMHFTDVENIPQILEKGGLVTRWQLESSMSDFKHTDKRRLDGLRDSISLSVDFPNYLMFFKKRNENPERRWCVFAISAEKIVDKLLIVNTGNAAASTSESKKITEEGCPELFAALFDEEVGECKRGTGLKKSNVTNPQSEILCLEKIPLEDIQKCYFSYGDLDIRKQYENLLIEHGIEVGSSNYHFSNGNYKTYYQR